MARGRRAAVATAPKVETVVLSTEPVEEVVEDLELEVTAEELAEEEAFAKTPNSANSGEDNDPYGFNDEDDEEDVSISPELSTKVVGNLVQITYKGLRVSGRVPITTNVIVPEDGTEPDDKEAIIRTGSDYRLRLDVPAYVSPEHADWLSRHPYWLIEKA